MSESQFLWPMDRGSRQFMVLLSMPGGLARKLRGKYCCGTFFINLHLIVLSGCWVLWSFIWIISKKRTTFTFVTMTVSESTYLAKKKNLLSVIPPELCQVIQGQLYKRKVPEYLTMKVVKFSKIKPQDCFRKIAQSMSFLLLLD